MEDLRDPLKTSVLEDDLPRVYKGTRGLGSLFLPSLCHVLQYYRDAHLGWKNCVRSIRSCVTQAYRLL